VSQEFKGFVVKINEKSGRGKKGPWTLYSAKLEKEDGTEYPEWLSLGFDAPKFKEGDFISLQAEKNDRGYLAAIEGTGKVFKNAPARNKKGSAGSASSGAADSSSGTAGPKRGGVDWNGATARAVETANLLLAAGALPLSGAKTKAGEAKRFDEVVAVVDKLTVKFYNDSITLRLLETVADTVIDTKPDGELPDSDDVTQDDDVSSTTGASKEDDDDRPF
jgi:hypothetical protein